MLEQSVLALLQPLTTAYWMLSATKDPEEVLSLYSKCFNDDFSALLKQDGSTACARARDINEHLNSEGPGCLYLLRSRITNVNSLETILGMDAALTSTDGTFQLCWHFSSTAFPLFQPFLLLTWTGFGSTNGMRASMVTTQGEMVVPRLLLRKGPRGTYSHFWMSRAGKRTFKAMQLNTS